MQRTLLAALSFSVATAAQAGVLDYTFDNDAEGWSVFSDGQNFMWDGDILGEAAIEITDVVAGNIWFFSAPSADLGDFSAGYGETLSWDIAGLRGNQTSIGPIADVILVGNGGVQIGVNAGVQPVLNQWTSWGVAVDTSAAWRHVTTANSGGLSPTLATESEIRGVLGSLTGIYIRGEYTNGADRAALDNVSFIPAPSGAALLGLGGLVVSRRRRTA